MCQCMYLKTEKEKILIKDVTERDKGIRYFCPNPNCDARMFLWNLEGESKSFFRASGTPGHVENCPLGSDNNYNPNNTKEEGFDSDDAIANLMTGENTQTSNRKTLQQCIKIARNNTVAKVILERTIIIIVICFKRI